MSAPAPEFFLLQRAIAGRYSLERELGRGGMGVVFLARDVALDRPVAIKLLPPPLASTRFARERFLREARTAARLSHPHIVPIHAVEEQGDLVFYVMAYVDGETLGQRVRRAGPLSTRDAMRVTQEVAWALGHAHAHGVVHRDVKPDNVLLERGSDRALVTDFGIARALSTLTPNDGTLVGTPAYMSPEQAAGDDVDGRSDIYSLGVTIFFAASGRLPFEGSGLALLARHATEPAPSLLDARPLLPRAFAHAIDRCLAKDPSARWPDADALARAIAAARGNLPEVAPAVRGFVREADSAGPELGTALTATGVALGAAAVLSDPIYSLVMLFGAALTGGLAGVRFGQLVTRARALVASGYGHAAVRPALALDDRTREEEQAETAATDGTTSQRRFRVAALSSVGALKTAFCYWLMTTSFDETGILNALGVGGAIVVPTATLRMLWAELRDGKQSLWHRMLRGRFGRGVFKLAGTRLPMLAPALPAAGEATVVVLARAADELYAALPAEARDRFADVPALLERLQADALRLQRRGDDPTAAARLAETAAAIELVRLDLLRLHAGHGSLDDLTGNVNAARELGARIDAELDARVEVREMLAPPTRETTPV